MNTADQYDLLVRKEMASLLEGGQEDISTLFTRLNHDTAREAKDKAERAVARAGKAASRGGASAAAVSQPPGAGKGGGKPQRTLSPTKPPLRDRSRTPGAWGTGKGKGGGKGHDDDWNWNKSSQSRNDDWSKQSNWKQRK